MIFKRGRKRGGESPSDELTDDASLDEPSEPQDAADDAPTATEEMDMATDLEALEDVEWRNSGPYDVSEVEDFESTEESPKVDLGSLILTPVPGSELRLQVAEETGEIVSAMLVIETIVEPVIGRTVDVPPALAELLDRPTLSTPLVPRLEELAKELDSWK